MITNTSFEYEYAALAISVLLFVLYRDKQKVHLAVYRTLFWMIFSCLSMSILDLAVAQMMEHGEAVGYPALYVTTIIFYFVSYGMGVVFILYCLSLANINVMYDQLWKLVVMIPSTIWMVIVFTAPVHKQFFYFDDSYQLVYGSWSILCSVLGIVNLIIGLIIVIIYRKGIGLNNVFIICFSVLFVGGICTLSFFLNGQFRVTLPVSVCLVLLVYGVKKKGERIDAVNSMSYTVFENDFKILSGRNINKKDMGIYLIKLKDYSLLYETFGEELFNQVLRQFTGFLRDITKGGYVYRLKDDFFAVGYLVTGEGAIEAADKAIIERFKREFSTFEINTVLTPYIARLLAEEISDIDDFKNIANTFDSMLKETNRIYRSSEISLENDEEKILSAVRKAMDNNSFKVFYQPIYSTKEKKIVAAEALIRLIDDEIGFISPEIFIPLAEKHGLIQKIGKFVFKEVCKFYSENKLIEKGIEYIEVNLSGVQMMQYMLAEDFCDIMDGWHLDHSRINFEITETSAMKSNYAVKKNIDFFLDSGVELSLDDYGTGYSNISYLYKIPFSILKVDKSILWASDENEKAEKVLASTIATADRLDMRVVVEGVENELHIKKLLALGCHYFQGFYFSKPVPGIDFIKYVDNFLVPEVCK